LIEKPTLRHEYAGLQILAARLQQQQHGGLRIFGQAPRNHGAGSARTDHDVVVAALQIRAASHLIGRDCQALAGGGIGDRPGQAKPHCSLHENVTVDLAR
jgi:hypothetical protein